MRRLCLEVAGPYACFTRPEMKVERVSYDVITPSAARAIFEAILWKPAIRWQVKEIQVLLPIRWISVRRNEVGAVASVATAQAARKSGKGNLGIFIDETDDQGRLKNRQQRAGLFLRDVKYRLFAEFEMVPQDQRAKVYGPVSQYAVDTLEAEELRKADERPWEAEAKYVNMFERRARKGQCFNQPYLGCREFSAAFRLVDPVAEPVTVPDELAGIRELGWMLYDRDYTDLADIKPLIFRARMENGVVMVPDRNDRKEVRG